MMDGEKSEISKFIKFLAFKYSQIIVQSRLGGLIYTKCNTTGTDWVRTRIYLAEIRREGHKISRNGK
jgi:Na+/H+-translocating membrane pyrophosphatase